MADPRILIVTPRLRLFGRALASVAAARRAYGQPVDTLELENDQPWPCIGPDGNRNVLYLYQRAREVFLRGDWTHMLCVEDDMVLPEHAISALLATGADVAYGLYCWRRGPPHLWSAYRYVFEDSGESSVTDNPHRATELFAAGAVVEVNGVGLGCTLIRREVLERVPWRLGDTGGANDWYFAVDCQREHVRQVAHFGVVCGHIRSDPSLRIIWPDPQAQGFARIEYLESR